MGRRPPDRLFLRGVQYMIWKTGIREKIRNSGRWVQNTSYYPYKYYVSGLVTALRQIAPNRYTDADPFKSLTVKTSDIIYETDDFFRHRGWVLDGDWDLNRSRIDNSDLYQCLKNRFVEECTWEKSGYIEYATKEIEKESNAWGLSSYEEIESRCGYLDQLYESIRKSGYKSQKELVRRTSDTYYHNVDAIHPELNEIGIDIGRNGELLFNRVGHHRLIMSKLLDISFIPVLVYRRHWKWQQTRDNTVDNDGHLDEKLCPHPDLQDIVKRNNIDERV